jgi:hypothetical protein
MTDTSDPAWHVVHRYSRAQALADQVLVDISDVARDAGIRYPIAVTATAWALAVDLTDAARAAGCDRVGRTWDVCWMLRWAMANAAPHVDDLQFRVLVVRDQIEPTLVTLRAICGPGDDGEPVITVCIPEED